MRMMLRVTFPTDMANGAMKGGSFQQVIEATMNKLKPEAAYFIWSPRARDGTLFNARLTIKVRRAGLLSAIEQQ